MKYFRKVADGIDISAALAELEAHPELWNVHHQRLKDQNGPFAGTSDIWVRYRAIEELTEPKKFGEPHFAIFYPSWHLLPAIHPIVFDLMARERAVHLGGILITKIPPGGVIKPHHDRGGWHAEFYNSKIYVPLKTNGRCVNHCGDESVYMKCGEAWFFDNLVTHSVINRGDSERVTLIVCLRTEN